MQKEHKKTILVLVFNEQKLELINENVDFIF